jgi:hypothetical protein
VVKKPIKKTATATKKPVVKKPVIKKPATATKKPVVKKSIKDCDCDQEACGLRSPSRKSVWYNHQT